MKFVSISKKMFFYSLTLSSALLLCDNANSKNSYAQAQELYKKIGNDLINIRKEYPGAQPTIYPLLDQVSQLLKISKNAIMKKKALKQKVKANQAELSKMIEENNRLKKEFSDLQKNISEKQKDFEQINKKLENKELHLTLLSKEKDDLQSKVGQLEEQQLQQKVGQLEEQHLEQLGKSNEPEKPE